MIEKSIEIYYDIADIPGISDRSGFSSEALDFRNDAMHHVEAALEAANAGEWEGAEIGSGEVNFGFSVEDFDEAERVVREAVAGTRYENIREIQRHKFDTDELANMEFAAPPLKFRLLTFALSLVLIPFVVIGLVTMGLRRALSR